MKLGEDQLEEPIFCFPPFLHMGNDGMAWHGRIKKRFRDLKRDGVTREGGGLVGALESNQPSPGPTGECDQI